MTASVLMAQSSPASDLLVTLSARRFWPDDLFDDDTDGGSSSDERAPSSASPGVGFVGYAAIGSSSTLKAPLECERARLT